MFFVIAIIRVGSRRRVQDKPADTDQQQKETAADVEDDNGFFFRAFGAFEPEDTEDKAEDGEDEAEYEHISPRSRVITDRMLHKETYDGVSYMTTLYSYNPLLLPVLKLNTKRSISRVL